MKSNKDNGEREREAAHITLLQRTWTKYYCCVENYLYLSRNGEETKKSPRKFKREPHGRYV